MADEAKKAEKAEKTVKVLLLVARATTGATQQAGDILDVGEAEAKRMEAAGQCDILSDAEAEVAMKRRGKRGL